MSAAKPLQKSRPESTIPESQGLSGSTGHRPIVDGEVKLAVTRALIEGVLIFEDIRNELGAIEALLQYMQLKRWDPMEVILQEGTIGSEMYVLIEGRAIVVKSTPDGDTYHVANLEGAARPSFGEGALIDTEARTATICAETTVVCLVLMRSNFEKFSAEHPHWAIPIYHRIAGAVLTRLRKTNNDLMLLYKALVAEIRGH